MKSNAQPGQKHNIFFFCPVVIVLSSPFSDRLSDYPIEGNDTLQIAISSAVFLFTSQINGCSSSIPTLTDVP